MGDIGYLANAIQGAANTGVAAASVDSNSRARNREIDQQALASQRYNDYLQNQSDNQQKQQLYSQIMAGYDGLMKSSFEVIKESKASNIPPAQIANTLQEVQSYIANYEQQAASLGLPIKPGTGAATLNAFIHGTPTATEMGASAGQAKGHAAIAQYNQMAPTFGQDTASIAASGVPFQKPYQQIPGLGTLNQQTGQVQMSPEMKQGTIDLELAKPRQPIINGPTWLTDSYSKGIAEPQAALSEKVNIAYDAVNAMKQLNGIAGDTPMDMAANLRVLAQKWGDTLGIDPGLLDKKGVDVYDVMQKGMQAAALKFGQSMKGNFSEKDRDFVMNMPPSIYMTPTGRQLLTTFYNVAAQNAEDEMNAGAAVIGKYQRMGSITPPPQDEYDSARAAVRDHPNVLIYDPQIQQQVQQATKEASQLPMYNGQQPPTYGNSSGTEGNSSVDTSPSPDAAAAIKQWRIDTGQ